MSDADIIIQTSLNMARADANRGRLLAFAKGLHIGRVQAAQFMGGDSVQAQAESARNEIVYLADDYQHRHFPVGAA